MVISNICFDSLTCYRPALNPNVFTGDILLLPLGHFSVSGLTRDYYLLSSYNSILGRQLTSIFWVSLEGERIVHFVSQADNGIEKSVLQSHNNFTGLWLTTRGFAL